MIKDAHIQSKYESLVSIFSTPTNNQIPKLEMDIEDVLGAMDDFQDCFRNQECTYTINNWIILGRLSSS